MPSSCPPPLLAKLRMCADSALTHPLVRAGGVSHAAFQDEGAAKVWSE